MAPHILNIESPSVEPSGAPGGDFEQIRTSPEMFGGFGAQAKEQVGRGLVQGADATISYLDETNRLQNQVHASQIHSWFSDQASGLVSEFSQLEGKTALDRLPEYKSRLQDLQKQAQSQSGSPQETSLIAVNTRNTMDRYQNWMVGHADKQRDRWVTETADNNITSAIGMGGMAVLNVDLSTLDRQLRMADQEAHNKFDGRGLDPDALAVEVSKEKGKAVKNWVETAATNDKDPDNISHAMSIFERYTKQIDPESRLTLAKYLNKAAEARTVDRLGNYYIGGANSSPLMPQIAESAAKYGIDPGLLSRQLYQESGLNPKVRPSSAGAQGVAQFMPETARRYGVNVRDPESSIEGAAHYMSDLKAQFGGNDGLALAGYNWGENHVAAWLASGANPAMMPAETRNYVQAITGQSIQSWVAGTAKPNINRIDPDAILTRIQSDPAFRDRPELQRAVMQNVVQKASIFNRAEAIKNKQDKEQSDGAELDFFKRIHGDDPKLTLDEIFKNSQNSGGPLSKEATERLTKEFETRGGSTKVDRTYGAGFYDLYRRVHLPDGDPERVTDPSQLYGHVGPSGDLTVSGVDKLSAEIQGRKTPEGVAEGEMKAQFLKNARAQITGSDEGLHIKDPKGDELYLRFLAQALPLYDAQKKAGKSAAQLLNPDSPDYVGKVIGNFRRPMDQWFSDTIHDNAAPAGGFDASAVKSLDDLVAAYRAGKVDKAAADQLAISKGWAVRNAPRPPISQ